MQLYERALSIRRSTLGNASFETAATLNNIGNFKRIMVRLGSLRACSVVSSV